MESMVLKLIKCHLFRKKTKNSSKEIADEYFSKRTDHLTEISPLKLKTAQYKMGFWKNMYIMSRRQLKEQVIFNFAFTGSIIL